MRKKYPVNKIAQCLCDYKYGDFVLVSSSERLLLSLSLSFRKSSYLEVSYSCHGEQMRMRRVNYRFGVKTGGASLNYSSHEGVKLLLSF